MSKVPTKVLKDAEGRPVAVQIAYADWVEIEATLSALDAAGTPQETIEAYRGTITLSEDALAYQRRIRGEWS